MAGAIVAEGGSEEAAMKAFAVTTAAAVFLAVGTAGAQTVPPPVRSTPAPQARPAPEPHQVEGKVSKVDPASQTIGVSRGWFGLFGRTLQVTDHTEIRIAGRGATLGEVQEGDRVKASFEVREGKSVATSIEVSPEEPSAPPPARGTPGLPRPPSGSSRPATQ
jgi:hypothetical protein